MGATGFTQGSYWETLTLSGAHVRTLADLKMKSEAIGCLTILVVCLFTLGHASSALVPNLTTSVLRNKNRNTKTEQINKVPFPSFLF